MKKIFKNISLIAFAGIIGFATVGCEDMFKAENALVEDNLTPQDTLYSVMGIVKSMQKLATRSVLLGEVRADLVSANPQADAAIQELGTNKISESNEYNNPTDFYAVINNCNIYLANVDTAQTTHGEIYYEKEILAVKIIRAWTYLELAKIYGSVPFVLTPVTTSADAEEFLANAQWKNINEVCTYFIKEIEDYLSYNYRWNKNNGLLPDYKGTFASLSMSKFFIPARVMLGELYLWLGSATGSEDAFINAIRYYHDYLTFPNEEHPVGYNKNVTWSSRQFANTPSDSYASGDFFKPGSGTDYVAYIPVDTLEYYGTVSDLRSVFCATYKNDYYAQVRPSDRLKELSKEPYYCKYVYTSQTVQDTLYAPRGEAEVDNPAFIGDLRYYAVCNIESVNDKYHDYNNERQYILKYTEGSRMLNNDQRLRLVPLYRYTTIYLHMAEALNRAGFPETAFAILKYGLCEEILSDPSIISDEEYYALANITSKGITASRRSYFRYEEDTRNVVPSFLDWDYSAFILNDPTLGTLQTQDPTVQGVHDHGSGDSRYNAYYTLPRDPAIWAEYDQNIADAKRLNQEFIDWQLANQLTSVSTHEDSLAFWAQYDAYLEAINTKGINAATAYEVAKAEQREYYPDFVAQKILEEEALEGMFEGVRFYDLMRWAMYNGDPDFVGTQVAKRDAAAGSALMGGKWYLPLRKR